MLSKPLYCFPNSIVSPTVSPNNYRPITNIPTLAKLLEKCVQIELCNHIENYNLLDSHQSGFRKGHSTEFALTHIMGDILKLLDRNESCLMILLDLSSAFDTVKHDNLLALLERRMGLSGTVLQWFSSFLYNRTQRIKMKNSILQPSIVTLGVPQGSALSPILFNLLMEPLANALNSSNILYHLYADDTQLYLKISTPEDLIDLNTMLLNTQSWLTNSHLMLNTKKTEFILISPPSHSPKLDLWLKHLTSFDCVPVIIDSAKSLGITIDKHLNMQSHISNATKGANHKLSILRKLKPFLPQADLKMAVQALVLPRLDYGSTTLCGLPKYKLAPLRAALNAAARLVSGTKRNSHISPTLKALN